MTNSKLFLKDKSTKVYTSNQTPQTLLPDTNTAQHYSSQPSYRVKKMYKIERKTQTVPCLIVRLSPQYQHYIHSSCIHHQLTKVKHKCPHLCNDMAKKKENIKKYITLEKWRY